MPGTELSPTVTSWNTGVPEPPYCRLPSRYSRAQGLPWRWPVCCTTRAMIPAKAGAPQEVPPTSVGRPLVWIR